MQFELAFICAIVTQTDYKPSVEDVLRAMNKVTYEDNACTPPSCFEYKGAHAYMPYVDETVCSTYVVGTTTRTWYKVSCFGNFSS